MPTAVAYPEATGGGAMRLVGASIMAAERGTRPRFPQRPD